MTDTFYPEPSPEQAALMARVRKMMLIAGVTTAIAIGAVTPRYVQAGHFIIAVAPWAGLLDGDEQVAVIDIRRRIEPATAE